MTRLTAMIIQSRGDDIRCEILGEDKETGKISGCIMLYNDDVAHTMLLSSPPIFNTSQECIEKMKQAVEEIRKLDLTKV